MLCGISEGEAGGEAGVQLGQKRGPQEAEHFNAEILSLGENAFFPPL